MQRFLYKIRNRVEDYAVPAWRPQVPEPGREARAVAAGRIITQADIRESISLDDAAARLGARPHTLRYHVMKQRIPELRAWRIGFDGPVSVPASALEGARAKLERLVAEAAPRAALVAAAKGRKAATRVQQAEQRRRKRAGK